jgi:hypothetical protein
MSFALECHLSRPWAHRLAESKRPELRGRDVPRATCFIDREQRFVDALSGHLERAEVHADARGRAEIEMSLYRLRWIHVIEESRSSSPLPLLCPRSQALQSNTLGSKESIT